MQKILAFVALALALNCAIATYTPANYVKAPMSVCADTDTNFTNATTLGLASITIGDIYLFSGNYTPSTTTNASNSVWLVFLRKLDSKALTVGANSTYTFNDPQAITFYNNYVIAFAVENDTNTPQLNVYQQPLTGGAALPRVTLSNNTNSTWLPLPAGGAIIGKTYYIFYMPASQKVNITNFAIGGSVGTGEFTLTSTFNSGLSVAWGESLGSTQLQAAWIELDGSNNAMLKDTVVDVSKGTSSPANVGGYASGYACMAFATDKKLYGDICSLANSTYGTTVFYLKSNSSGLLQVANYTTNTSTLAGVYPYGPYLALVFADSVTASPSMNYNYEIWQVDTLAPVTMNGKNRTLFLTIDGNSTFSNFRVTSGGLFTLLYNKRTQANGTLTSVQVGLLLGNSYLTTVFGLLLAIIAGLFLF